MSSIAIAGSGVSGITIGTTTITGGTSTRLLYDNAGKVDETNNMTWNNASQGLVIGSGTIDTDGGRGVPVTSPQSDTAGHSIALGTSLANQSINVAYSNTAIGFGSMGGVITASGFHNTAICAFALQSITSGSENMAVGLSALANLTTGQEHTAVGNSALTAQVGGRRATAIGYNAGVAYNESSSAGSTFIGAFAFSGALAGPYNTGVGRFSGGTFNATVTGNTLIGEQSFGGATSGDYNTVIGFFGGVNITSGSNNTLIGAWQGPAGAQSNVIALSLGGANVTTTQLDYNFTNASKWTFAAPPVVPNFTVGALPAGVAGAEAYVTDADAGLAWGATAVNSGAGATKYLVWYNGTNWTVVGK